MNRARATKHRSIKPQRRCAPVEVRTARRERIAARKQRGTHGGEWLWLADKRPVFRFVVVLSLLMAVFNACFYLWFFEGAILRFYLHLYAEASAALLRTFGEGATAVGIGVLSPRFSLSINVGCDAIQPSAFFVFAVLASPSSAPLRKRIVPIAIGTLFLAGLNLIRIISLYFTGVYFPNAFELMHVEVWQAVFIFVPLFFWMIWVRWAARRTTVVSHVRS